MTIKITDTLLNKPLYAGGGSDGTENVTRMFGNREEQPAALPSAPNGWGGQVNAAAGQDAEARGKAVQVVASSVMDHVNYAEALKAADEDSRQQSMFLRIEQRTEALRRNLRADPNLAAQSEEAQQAAYEMQRDLLVDEEVQRESFASPKIKKFVQDQTVRFKTKDSTDYVTRVLAPQMVAARKARDADDIGTVIGTAQAAQTPEAVTKALEVIESRTSSDAALRTYGAAEAESIRLKMRTALEKGVLEAALASTGDRFDDLGKKIGATGLLAPDALGSGPIADLVKDEVGRVDALMAAAGANEGERLLARERAEKTAKTYAKAAIATHNQVVTQANRERAEAEDGAVTQFGNKLFAAATNGAATDTAITKTTEGLLRSLGIDPVAAVEGKLTDPRQIRLYDKVYTEVLKARGEQKKYQRELERDARDRERLRLQREAAIMPSTQKASDASYTDFVKQAGLADKNPLQYTTDDWAKVTGYLHRTSPTHLPAQLDGAIRWGINSSNKAAQDQSMAIAIHLQKVAPGLLAQLPTRERSIIERRLTGQDHATAVAEQNRWEGMTPDQRDAVKLTARKTTEQWQDRRTHPVAEKLGVQYLEPNVLALANREYEDAIARGEPPAVAEKSMLAKVQKVTGKTTLMSADGSEKMVVNSPVAVFNVGAKSGPGWFARQLGARPEDTTVSEDILRADIKANLKEAGHNPDQKFYLGQPVTRNGKTYYPIILSSEAISRPAADKNGNPLFWTFDPDNNEVMRKRRADLAEWDSKQSAAKNSAAVDQEYKNLVAEAQRKGTAPTPTDPNYASFYRGLRAQARKSVTGKE